MDHEGGKESAARRFAAAEAGGSAIETALLLGLAAVFALAMRELLAAPLLGAFTHAAQAIDRALSG